MVLQEISAPYSRIRPLFTDASTLSGHTPRGWGHDACTCNRLVVMRRTDRRIRNLAARLSGPLLRSNNWGSLKCLRMSLR